MRMRYALLPTALTFSSSAVSAAAASGEVSQGIATQAFVTSAGARFFRFDFSAPAALDSGLLCFPFDSLSPFRLGVCD